MVSLVARSNALLARTSTPRIPAPAQGPPRRDLARHAPGSRPPLAHHDLLGPRNSVHPATGLSGRLLFEVPSADGSVDVPDAADFPAGRLVRGPRSGFLD